jgi:pyruvate dehydrogenase E1 component alpha subunit
LKPKSARKILVRSKKAKTKTRNPSNNHKKPHRSDQRKSSKVASRLQSDIVHSNKDADAQQTSPSKELLQILNPEGILVGEDPGLSKTEVVDAYCNMVLTRILDEKLIGLQRQGRMGTYVSCSGQEASQIGSVLALAKDKDWIFPMYRDMGMIIQAGVPVDQLINRMFGNSADIALGRDLPNLYAWKEKRIVSFAAPIASHVPLATGFAMAAKLSKDDSVCVATFGDGATSSAEFHVAMNFAGVYKAPIVFICENNQYAISVPVSQQTASESIAIKAVAYGFDGVRVDGNDLFGVYSAVKKAVDKARKGMGPSLVECSTYRMGSHSTADDWKKYRSNEEVESWKKRDPIQRMKHYMIDALKVWNEEEDAKLRSEIETKISGAISSGENIPPPKPDTMFNDVYSSVTRNLEEQRKEMLESETVENQSS